MTKKDHLKTFIIGLSLANLLTFPVWYYLLHVKMTDYFYFDVTPLIPITVLSLCAFVFFVIGLGLMNYWVIIGCQRSQSKYVRGTCYTLYAILLFYVINKVIIKALEMIVLKNSGRFPWYDEYYKFILLILPTLAFIGMVWLVIKKREFFFKYTQRLLIVASPLLLITFSITGSRVYQLLNDTSGIQRINSNTSLAHLKVSPEVRAPRIIFMIFDELDIRFAFERRMNNLQLPNLDSFRNESLYATQAYAAGPSTLISVPSMLFGTNYLDAKAQTPSSLLLKLSSQEWISSDNQTSIFHSLNQKDHNNAVVGIYHPYMRLFGDSLAYCKLGFAENNLENSFSGILLTFLSRIYLESPFVYQILQDSEDALEGSFAHQHKKEAIEAILNPNYHFVFIHWAFPHPPEQYKYLHKKEKYLAYERGYSGNLLIVDEVLEEIASKLKNINLWNDSAIIISSDHQLRKIWLNFPFASLKGEEAKRVKEENEERVPFLIKMPGQQQTLEYDKPFNMTAVYGLIQGIVDKKIKTPEDVVEWLDQYPVKKSYSQIIESSKET